MPRFAFEKLAVVTTEMSQKQRRSANDLSADMSEKNRNYASTRLTTTSSDIYSANLFMPPPRHHCEINMFIKLATENEPTIYIVYEEGDITK